MTGVVLCSKEQADLIRAMVLGCSKQYYLSLVVLDAEGPQRVPGLVQDQLQFRRAQTGFLKSDAKHAVPGITGAETLEDLLTEAETLYGYPRQHVARKTNRRLDRWYYKWAEGETSREVFGS